MYFEVHKHFTTWSNNDKLALNKIVIILLACELMGEKKKRGWELISYVLPFKIVITSKMNVCVPPKCMCGNSNSKSDSIRRRGLWELGHGSRVLMNEINVLTRKAIRISSPWHVRIQWEDSCLQAGKEPIVDIDLVLPRLQKWEINSLV